MICSPNIPSKPSDASRNSLVSIPVSVCVTSAKDYIRRLSRSMNVCEQFTLLTRTLFKYGAIALGSRWAMSNGSFDDGGCVEDVELRMPICSWI